VKRIVRFGVKGAFRCVRGGRNLRGVAWLVPGVQAEGAPGGIVCIDAATGEAANGPMDPRTIITTGKRQSRAGIAVEKAKKIKSPR